MAVDSTMGLLQLLKAPPPTPIELFDPPPKMKDEEAASEVEVVEAEAVDEVEGVEGVIIGLVDGLVWLFGMLFVLDGELNAAPKQI